MQKLRYSVYLKSIYALMDCCIIIGVFVLFSWREGAFILPNTEDSLLYLGLFIILWMLIGAKTEIYDIPRNLTFTKLIERVISQLFIFLSVTYVLIKLGRYAYFVEDYLWILTSISVLILLSKSGIFLFLKLYRKQGLNHRNYMVLSENESITLLKDIINRREDYGYRYFEYQGSNNIDDIISYWKEKEIHTLFLPINHLYEKEEYNKILEKAYENKVEVALVPNNIYDQHFKYQFEYFDIQPVLTVQKLPLQKASNYLIKRIFDVLVSVCVLVFVGSWLFPLLAFIIKRDSKGSVFFKQKRYGYLNREFDCYKFRTMRPNAEANSHTTKENDPRITKIGAFLRKTSLDELPQFINVLKGEMSVVGPRPHMLSVDDYYKQHIYKYSLRSKVKPGITGLAQIKGLRGDQDGEYLTMRKRIKADAFYVKNWSFSMDLVIVVKTFFLLVFGDKKAY